MFSLHLIVHGDQSLHVYGWLICSIRELLKLEWMVELRHTLKEGMHVLTFFAKREFSYLIVL